MELVEKASVIDLIANSSNDLEYYSENAELQDMVRVLPSVERRIGKWIEIGGYVTPDVDPVWECSECGKGRHVYGIEHRSYGADIADHQWVACPNCGAVMRGEGKE